MKKTIIQCNMCGREMDEADLKNGLCAERRAGTGFVYADKAMRLDLCCDCLDNLIDSCRISPITEAPKWKRLGEYIETYTLGDKMPDEYVESDEDIRF